MFTASLNPALPARILTALAIGMLCGYANAEDESVFEFGGLMFGDIYHIANHHTEVGEGASGFVIRRGYLTADFNFDENWYARARIEINQSGEFETYDFEADFKDLYLARRIGRHRVVLGLSPPPTFDVIESIWGLRYLARTPMDMQGISSRDTGIAAAGPLNRSGSVTYRAMVGAGVDFGSESGDENKTMFALGWRPSDALYFDFYLDYERLPGNTDRQTTQVFAGNDDDDLRWGLMYSHQDRQDDPPLELASGFVVKSISDRRSLIGRVDRIIEPSPAGNNISYIPFDPTAPATMLIAGLEHRATEQIRVTPNIIWTQYDRNDEGIRPEDDLHIRVTLFLDFE